MSLNIAGSEKVVAISLRDTCLLKTRRSDRALKCRNRGVRRGNTLSFAEHYNKMTLRASAGYLGDFCDLKTELTDNDW